MNLDTLYVIILHMLFLPTHKSVIIVFELIATDVAIAAVLNL